MFIRIEKGKPESEGVRYDETWDMGKLLSHRRASAYPDDSYRTSLLEIKPDLNMKVSLQFTKSPDVT